MHFDESKLTPFEDASANYVDVTDSIWLHLEPASSAGKINPRGVFLNRKSGHILLFIYTFKHSDSFDSTNPVNGRLSFLLKSSNRHFEMLSALFTAARQDGPLSTIASYQQQYAKHTSLSFIAINYRSNCWRDNNNTATFGERRKL